MEEKSLERNKSDRMKGETNGVKRIIRPECALIDETNKLVCEYNTNAVLLKYILWLVGYGCDTTMYFGSYLLIIRIVVIFFVRIV